MTRRAAPSRAALVALLAAAATGSAAADTLILGDPPTAIAGCVVEDVRAGRVWFRDTRDRRDWRELAAVERIAFDDVPAIDEAERLFAADRDAEACAVLAAALPALESDRAAAAWLRVRLLRRHAARDELVPAAGHLAALCAMRDDPSWADLEPPASASLSGASDAQVREAFALLARAERSARSPRIQLLLERLRGRLAPIASRADGVGAAMPATLSGIPAPGAAPAVAAPTGAGASDSPEAIDALLQAGRYEAALEAVERAAADVAGRSIPRLLDQRGRAQRGLGRDLEAATDFMRIAILHEDSTFAAPALVAAARLHLGGLGRPDRAERLAEAARALARSRGDAATEREAEETIAEARAAIERGS